MLGRMRMVMVGALAVLAGCGNQPGESGTTPGGQATAAAGAGAVVVMVDGSSTVAPISEAVAEEFMKTHPNVRVAVGTSGTGGGFKKFAAGEIDISDASRPIHDKEAAAATDKGIEFIELPVAYDGLSVVVNPKNNWVDHLTTAELKAIWEPDSKIQNWKEVRAGFPDKPLRLYGAGTDSGTFDYFTQAINGKEKASRADYTASEDDNALVVGVAGDEGALGYFGYAYYEENKDKLKLVPVDNGSGPVAPSPETINNGTYSPLSRPIFIYASVKALQRKEVKDFVDFYLENAGELARDVGYIALSDEAYTVIGERLAAGKTGSAFIGKNTIGVTVEQLLAAEK